MFKTGIKKRNESRRGRGIGGKRRAGKEERNGSIIRGKDWRRCEGEKEEDAGGESMKKNTC